MLQSTMGSIGNLVRDMCRELEQRLSPSLSDSRMPPSFIYIQSTSCHKSLTHASAVVKTACHSILLTILLSPPINTVPTFVYILISYYCTAVHLCLLMKSCTCTMNSLDPPHPAAQQFHANNYLCLCPSRGGKLHPSELAVQ